jgi:flagellar hook-length control protein FliK
MTDAQKLDLANQSLLTQRLPSATPEVLHPGALKAKNTTNIKGNDSELATISLGPNSQIVTSTKNPPTEKSLSDFAKSMGFTKTAIARLFGSDDSAQAETSPATATQSVLNNGLLATVSNDPNALTSGSTLTANALSPSTLSLSINPTMDAPAAATSLNAGTALNPLSQLPSLSSNNSTLTPTPSIDPALDAAAALTATALPGATAAAVLNPMSGTLNGNLVSANTLTGTINANLGDLNELMMQNGATLKSGSVNFASTLNALNQAGASVSNPSTLSVLNMTGSELTGSAIEALQSEFNKLTNSGHLSSTGEADTNAFGLALTPDANSISAGASRIDLGSNTAGNPSASSGNTADGSSFLNANGSSNVGNMADTYEKLSNQLTAELSRRMNDQISQGQWKMKFALKPSSLGAVDVQIEMKDGKLAANFQADNALTQSLLQHGSNQLKDNLKGLGLTQTDVQVGQNQTQSGSGQNSGSNFAGQNPFAPAPKPQLANANIAQDSNPPVDVSIKGASTDGNLDLFA